MIGSPILSNACSEVSAPIPSRVLRWCSIARVAAVIGTTGRHWIGMTLRRLDISRKALKAAMRIAGLVHATEASGTAAEFPYKQAVTAEQ